MIGIIDYGSGNIHAIANLYKRLDIPHVVTSDAAALTAADKLILPGVGDFDETMLMLKNNGLVDLLNHLVLDVKKPILGVCVGMQILGESSDEGTQSGFGWIKGHVKRLKPELLPHRPHLPHMGWNSVELRSQSPLFRDIDTETGFYFLHSYYFDNSLPDDALCTTVYGLDFSSAVQHENVIGVQFHPEKSHANGILLFKNYAELQVC
jgi:imidazole glycerol-phosphate synthase subunit HisH